MSNLSPEQDGFQNYSMREMILERVEELERRADQSSETHV